MTPSPEKLLNIIESDESIRKALRALNELIEPSSLSMKESMSQGYNGIWVSGVGVFIRTKKFDAHAEKIRVRLTRTFGAFADEVWFAGCIIQYAGEVLKKRENATIKFFCSIVAKAVHRTLVAFPCRNIKLLNVDVIDLGYSKVYSADSLLKLLEPNFEKSGVTNADFTSNLGHISIFFEGWGVAKFAAAEAYWVVDTSAPTELWGEYLEIAAQRSLSLLRCHIDPFDVLEENLISYYPHQTDVEVDPILGWTDWSNKVIVRDGVILKGGGKLASIYPITTRFADALRSDSFLEIIGKFQNIRPNTIAAALSDSFYWQSKARQSINRAERVLFFFTALEAIVSRRDTTTPVSETVARSTASLMSTEHAARSEISAELKKMYASRSKIVHQGMASTYASVGSRLQEIVEIITKRVIKEADLGKPLNSFHEHLTEASFGSQLDLSKL